MDKHKYGYRCSIQFNGHRYIVLRLRGDTPPFAFYQKDVGKTVTVAGNPEKEDLFCYCSTKRGTKLTLPPKLASLIKKGLYPITF